MAATGTSPFDDPSRTKSDASSLSRISARARTFLPRWIPQDLAIFQARREYIARVIPRFAEGTRGGRFAENMARDGRAHRKPSRKNAIVRQLYAAVSRGRGREFVLKFEEMATRDVYYSRGLSKSDGAFSPRNRRWSFICATCAARSLISMNITLNLCACVCVSRRVGVINSCNKYLNHKVILWNKYLPPLQWL